MVYRSALPYDFKRIGCVSSITLTLELSTALVMCRTFTSYIGGLGLPPEYRDWGWSPPYTEIQHTT